MHSRVYGSGSFTTPQFLNDIRGAKVAAMARAMNRCPRAAPAALVEGCQLVLSRSIVISAVVQAVCCRVLAIDLFMYRER